MKALIDTNVLLDVLCNRTGFVEDSKKVWKYCELKKIDGYVSALSIPNIVYILRKELDPEKTESVLDQLALIFKITDLNPEDLKKAASLRFNDYEDALQCVTAARIDAKYIVTRNIRDYQSSTILALTPTELLGLM